MVPAPLMLAALFRIGKLQLHLRAVLPTAGETHPAVGPHLRFGSHPRPTTATWIIPADTTHIAWC